MRATGRVPAVIYGRQTKPQNLEIDGVVFKQVMHNAASEIVLLDLSIKGDAKPKRLAIVREVQHHPLLRKTLHADLHEVAEDEKVTLGIRPGGKHGRSRRRQDRWRHPGTCSLFKLKARAVCRAICRNRIDGGCHQA